jgi:UDP-N-acetyl-D-mannosaminuronic acid dehydrogenase
MFATSGFSVIGSDRDVNYVSTLKEGRMLFKEDDANGLFSKMLHSKKLRLTVNAEEAIRESDIIMVTVGTPITDRYKVNYLQIRGVLQALVNAGIEDKALGFRSTMGPGTTEELIIPFLQEQTGLKLGGDFLLAVCPERILEGRAYEELRNLPEIVGSADEASGTVFGEIFRRINPDKEIVRLPIAGAELAKLFTNIYRYANFALANEFAIWAERYNQDAHEIIAAANFKYPRARIPIPGFSGGPCLAKDGFLLDNATTFTSMISSAWKLNEAIPQHVAESIKRALGGSLYSKRIGVLGIAYKSGIDDIRLSPAAKLVDILTEQGAIVAVYDPHVPTRSHPLEGITENKDCIVIAVNHPEFVTYAKKISQSGCKLIYDVWGMFSKDDFKNSVYMRFGSGK